MFSVLLVSNPSTLLDHTEARKAEKCFFFFLRPPTPFISGSGWPGPPYLKAWSATDNEVSLYRGSFSYILLLLRWRRSFVIPRTLLYRCSLYRGSSVWGNLVKVNKLCQSLGPSVPGGGTLGISGWGCAAGTLEPLTYTRASWAEFWYPILE